MRSTKTIGLFAACGFVLSFVAGLFSHSSILSILIKALIFAVVFGALGFGISVVFSKFLSTGNSGDFQSDYSVDSVSGTTNASAPVTGQHVDITIQDEDLKPSESENHFVVGDNHQMLNESDMASSSGYAHATETSNGFVPVRNLETLTNISGKEAVSPSQASSSNETLSSNSSANSAAGFAGEGIDTLPDMDGFVFGESESSQSSSEEVADTNTDSEFVASSGSHKKDDGPAEVKDAALMAKAISSILSDENS